MDLASRALTNLTKSHHFEEHARYSPDGKKIAFMSSAPYDWLFITYQTELMLMNPDGSNKRMLTHFNVSGLPRFRNRRRSESLDAHEAGLECGWHADGPDPPALGLELPDPPALAVDLQRPLRHRSKQRIRYPRWMVLRIVGAGLVGLSVLILAADWAARALARELPAPAGACSIKEMAYLTEGGEQDWSHANDLLVYDRMDAAGVYQLYTIQPDGSEETCLTCDIPVGWHRLNPGVMDRLFAANRIGWGHTDSTRSNVLSKAGRSNDYATQRARERQADRLAAFALPSCLNIASPRHKSDDQ